MIFSRPIWYERLFLLLFSVLIVWEVGLAVIYFKAVGFPYGALDFFQHFLLGHYVNRGGSPTDPTWPRRAGETMGLYLPLILEHTAPFLPYQLIVLPLFRVLALLSPAIAYAVWLIGNIVGMGWVGSRIAPEIGIRRLALALAPFIWPPVWRVLFLGNMDSLVWILMGLGWWRFLEGREREGGFWMGLAAALKGFPAFAALPWLIRRPRATLPGLAAGIAAGVAWGTLWGRVDGWRFMIQHLPDYQRALTPFMPDNNSVLAVLWALFGPPVQVGQRTYHGLWQAALPEPTLYRLHLLVSLALIALAAWALGRRPGLHPMAQSGAWLSMGLVVWPVSWTNYHIGLFIPIAWLIARWERLPSLAQVLLGVALFPISAALSHDFLNSLTAPWMVMPLLMVGARLLLFYAFARAAAEVADGDGPGWARGR